MITVQEQVTRNPNYTRLIAICNKEVTPTGGVIFAGAICHTEKDQNEFRALIDEARNFESQIPSSEVLVEKHMPELMEKIRRSHVRRIAAAASGNQPTGDASITGKQGQERTDSRPTTSSN